MLFEQAGDFSAGVERQRCGAIQRGFAVQAGATGFDLEIAQVVLAAIATQLA